MNTSTYDNTFLNSLFTSQEYEFINRMDSDVKKIDESLRKEEIYRNQIVTYINTLNDMLTSNSSDNNILKAIDDSKNYFQIVNENIKQLNIYKESFGNIKHQIMDFLIKIDSLDNISEVNLKDDISKLKLDISVFTLDSKNIENDIQSNNEKIEEFLNKNNITSSIEFEYTKPTYNKLSDNIKESDKQDTYIAKNNNTLVVSEKLKKVLLPYSEKEILEYLEQYPNQYKSFEDVVRKEYIIPIDMYLKHPVIARFRESYSLIRDKEAMSILDAFKFAMEMMFRYEINPAIIAACKSKLQLEKYLDCLSRKKLDEFLDFEINFEINPL